MKTTRLKLGQGLIFTALEKKSLKPGQRASKLTLIRRVTYDLTGLPPQPDRVRAFLAEAGCFEAEVLQ